MVFSKSFHTSPVVTDLHWCFSYVIFLNCDRPCKESFKDLSDQPVPSERL